MATQYIKITAADGTELYEMTALQYLFGFKGRIGRLRYFTLSLTSGFLFFCAGFIVMYFTMAPFLIETLKEIQESVPAITIDIAYALNPNNISNYTLTPSMEIPRTFLSIMLLFSFIFVWINIALTVKRLHDIGITGWATLILFIPVVAFFLSLFLLFCPGTKGENSYGKAVHMLAKKPQEPI
ncbi:MAG: DUF805 domain-containing protein [Alphaproteobacteria bacterium]